MKRYIQLYILQVIFLILSSHFTHFRKAKCTQNMVITLRLYSSVFVLSIFYISYSVTKSCLTLGNPMDCILPGSSVHEIFQARILKRVAISSSRGSSRTRDGTYISWVSYTIRWTLPTAPSRKPLLFRHYKCNVGS